MTTEAKRVYMKAYREKNRERLVAADRARYEAKRDELKAQQKAYRDGNDELKAKKRPYYQANRERIIAKEKARYATQPERIQAVQREWRAANPDAVRARHNRRKARLASLPIEVYLASEIFDRDDWTCRLCDTQIERDLRWPDPMSASIDHIVPICRGGGDVRENVQATHLVCNLKKGRAVA